MLFGYCAFSKYDCILYKITCILNDILYMCMLYLHCLAMNVMDLGLGFPALLLCSLLYETNPSELHFLGFLASRLLVRSGKWEVLLEDCRPGKGERQVISPSVFWL